MNGPMAPTGSMTTISFKLLLNRWDDDTVSSPFSNDRIKAPFKGADFKNTPSTDVVVTSVRDEFEQCRELLLPVLFFLNDDEAVFLRQTWGMPTYQETVTTVEGGYGAFGAVTVFSSWLNP